MVSRLAARMTSMRMASTFLDDFILFSLHYLKIEKCEQRSVHIHNYCVV